MRSIWEAQRSCADWAIDVLQRDSGAMPSSARISTIDLRPECEEASSARDQKITGRMHGRRRDAQRLTDQIVSRGFIHAQLGQRVSLRDAAAGRRLFGT